MIRLCVLGNSHTSCLRRALEQPAVARRLGVVPTVFAATKDHLRSLELQGAKLVCSDPAVRRRIGRTSGGKVTVSFRDYDAFMVCGADGGLWRRVALVPDCHPHHGRIQYAEPRAVLVSKRAFREILWDELERSVAAHLVGLARRSRKPVLLMPSPMPCEGARQLQTRPWMRPRRPGDPVPWLCSTFREDTHRYAARENLHLVVQPATTLAPSGLTKDEYARLAPVPEDPARTEVDHAHTNAAYGALAWPAVADRLGDAIGRTALAG